MPTFSEKPHVYLDTTSHKSVDQLPVITSPNMPYPPHPFPNQAPLDLSTIRLPQWSSNKYPFLAWTPSSIQFEGPLFGRLHWLHQTLPIESYGDRWILSEDVRMRWHRLEHNLHTLASSLLDRAQLTPSFTFWPLPSRYGYLQTYPTEEDARHYAMYSRDAFVPLIAACSFAIANNIDSWDYDFPVPFWLRELVEKGVHPQYLENIQKSIVGDFTIDRAGMVIDPYSWEWRGQVNRMIRTNVPVWIHWGEKWDARTKHPEVADDYRPKLVEVNEARRSFGAPPPSEPVKDMPKPQAHSGQRRGETWQAFFARRGTENEKRRRMESPLELESRTNREKMVSQPGRSSKSARVFEWEEIDGFYIRTYVPRWQVEHIWEAYGKNQRRFDSFRNEWDLCTQFDVQDTSDHERWFRDTQDPPCPDLATLESNPPSFNLPPNSQDDFLLHDDFPLHDAGAGDDTPWAWHYQSSTSSVAPSSTTPSSTAPSSVAPSSVAPSTSQVQSPMTPRARPNTPSHISDLNNLNLDLVDLSLDDTPTELSHWAAHACIDSLEDALFQRYGLTLEIEDAQVDDKKWLLVRRILGYEDSKPSARCRFSITSFVDSMINPSLPRHKHDLTENRDVVWNSNVNITRLPNREYLIRGKTIDPSEHEGWVLVVSDPATALQCARSGWGPRKLDIVRELVHRGIQFNTMESLPRNPKSIPSYTRHCHSLGSRPAGYKPDLLDYQSYERTRDSYLRQPHARAALLGGGIVWRLSFDALGISPVLDGPTVDAIEYGIRTHALDSSGQPFMLYDDALTENETDLICGVYKIYTGINALFFSFFVTDVFS
jgi:hypothetical protein